MVKDHNARITHQDDAPASLARPRILFAPKGAAPRTPRIFKYKQTLMRVFGVEFDYDLYAWLEDPSTAREFTSEYWHVPRLVKEREAETSEADLHQIRALRLLRRAYSDDDEESAREVLKQVEKLCAFSEPLYNEPSTTSNRARVRLFYPLIFGEALKNARVRLWPTKEGEFVPVIWCDCMRTAMFAYAAFNGVETCPNCGKLFCTDVPRVDDSRSEKYCTVACGQRFRQKTYRQKRRKLAKRKSR